jgi:hypothetical protein
MNKKIAFTSFGIALVIISSLLVAMFSRFLSNESEFSAFTMEEGLDEDLF